METLRATVEDIDENHSIRIEAGDEEIRISMSADKPKEVKSAFNKLIARIKHGEFKIVLEQVGEDLFSQVANEYVTQLNREIHEVYGEMQQYGLVNEQRSEVGESPTSTVPGLPKP